MDAKTIGWALFAIAILVTVAMLLDYMIQNPLVAVGIAAVLIGGYVFISKHKKERNKV